MFLKNWQTEETSEILSLNTSLITHSHNQQGVLTLVWKTTPLRLHEMQTLDLLKSLKIHLQTLNNFILRVLLSLKRNYFPTASSLGSKARSVIILTQSFKQLFRIPDAITFHYLRQGSRLTMTTLKTRIQISSKTGTLKCLFQTRGMISTLLNNLPL